jgi:hypothetical protein
MKHAFNIKIGDKSVHVYMQRHPFLSEPNKHLNRFLATKAHGINLRTIRGTR